MECGRQAQWPSVGGGGRSAEVGVRTAAIGDSVAMEGKGSAV